MKKKDFIDCSPVRWFEKATSSVLKTGEMGLITAKKGLGKTSVLVQFGLDELLKDKSLIHVSFDQKSSNVISWYSSVLSEIAKKKHISNLAEFEDEIVKNRTILNFNQETFTLPKVAATIKALESGGIKIDSIVVDGLDLSAVSDTDLKSFVEFASKESLTVWFSYTCESEALKDTLPEEKLKLFATVAHISASGKELSLNVLKNGDGKVLLDSKTLLMSKGNL